VLRRFDFAVLVVFLIAAFKLNMARLEYVIKTTWDDQKHEHEPVTIKLEPDSDEPNNYLKLIIKAPFFNSPSAPDKQPGEYFNLWDYEGKAAFIAVPYGLQRVLSYPFPPSFKLLRHSSWQIQANTLRLNLDRKYLRF
jgi:hypothetical protein